MKKKTLLAAILFGTTLMALFTMTPEKLSAQAAQASPWKDRAEYDAFTAITTTTDPKQKVELADKYLAAYPESKFPDKVNEMKLQAYQQQNNVPKVAETAEKLVTLNPKHLYALFILSSIFPQTFNPQAPTADQDITKAVDRAKAGLAAAAELQKPAAVSDADFKKQKDQLEAQFHQTAGFASLQKKDFAQAETELKKSVEINPANAVGFYQLGLAYLTEAPKKYDPGMWSMARAVTVTGQTALPGPMQTQVKEYLNKAYVGLHGTDEGLDGLLAQATAAPFPPDGFHIKTVEELAPPEPEPTPEPAPVAKRELTVKPEELSSYDVIVKYLTSGGQKADDTWELLKGSTLTLPGKVIGATPAAKPDTIKLAVAPELATQDVKYDVEVTLESPSAKPIAKGSQMAFEGVVDAYTAKPFLLKLANAKVAK